MQHCLGSLLADDLPGRAKTENFQAQDAHGDPWGNIIGFHIKGYIMEKKMETIGIPGYISGSVMQKKMETIGILGYTLGYIMQKNMETTQTIKGPGESVSVSASWRTLGIKE